MWKWGFGAMLWRSDFKGGSAVLKRGNFSGFQGCEKEGEVKLEAERDEDRRTHQTSAKSGCGVNKRGS